MITMLVADLESALHAVIRAMDNRPANVAMQYVRLQLAGEYLYIDGGGQTNHAFTRIPASGKEIVGCINPRILLGVLPSVHNYEVTLAPQKTKLAVKRPTGDVKLATFNVDAFPPAPVAKDAADWIGVPREVIRDVISSLLCGTDEDAAVPTLWQNVALFKYEDGKLLALSSDGKRTALTECEAAGEGSIELQVPIRALRGLLAAERALPKEVEVVQIGQDKNHIWIKAGDGLRLMYGKMTVKFPDIFGKVLNKLQFTRKTSLRAQGISEALDLMKAVGDEKIRSFRLEAEANGFVFATAAPGRGEISERVEAKAEGDFPDFVAGYDADYLIPIFKQTAGPVTLEFAEMGTWFTNYPMKVTHEQENLKSSWLVQSLNIYPGSVKPKAEEKIA